MNNKTLSIVSYITIIGWLIAFFSAKDKTPKSSLVTYHLKQGFGLAIIGAVLSVLSGILSAFAFIFGIAQLVVFVLWIFGIINAMNEVEKPVPLIGSMFEGKFDFIN
jgi:uncharacterized membrane protein